MKILTSIGVFLTLCLPPSLASATECDEGANATNIGDFIININTMTDAIDTFGGLAATRSIAVMGMGSEGYTMTSRVEGLYEGPNGFITEAYNRLASNINASAYGPLSPGVYQLYLSASVTLPHPTNGTRQIGQGTFVCIELEEGESLEDALDDSEIDEWGHPTDPDRQHLANASYCDVMGNCMNTQTELYQPANTAPVRLEVYITYEFTFSCAGSNCTLSGRVKSMQVFNANGSMYTGPSVTSMFAGTTSGPSNQP